MRICLINKSFLFDECDGISTYTHILSSALAESGHKVYIIARGDHSLKTTYDRNISILTIPPLIKANFKLADNINNLFFIIQVFLKFLTIKDDIDIVEAPEVGAEGFFVALLSHHQLATRLHTPSYLIQSLDGVKVTLSRRFLYWMEKYQIKKSLLVSSPTKSLAEIVTRDLSLTRKIAIIPNPYIIFNAARKKVKKNNHILFIGRIARRKGIDILLAAAKKLMVTNPGLKIHIAGGLDRTYPKEHLERMLQPLTNIKLLGPVKYSDIASHIQNASLIIIPSLWENFPYVLLESLAMGKIVIASCSGGLQEIIEDGVNGFLVPPANVKMLAEKIKDCLKIQKSKKKQIQINAKKTAAKFADIKLIKSFLDFYNCQIDIYGQKRN